MQIYYGNVCYLKFADTHEGWCKAEEMKIPTTRLCKIILILAMDPHLVLPVIWKASGRYFSTDPWKLFTHKHINDTFSANSCFHHYFSWMSGNNFTDYGSIFPKFIFSDS